jgi:diguanylate cyclase (GGDEF)-like protein/PAS domain S-box-containing protein
MNPSNDADDVASSSSVFALLIIAWSALMVALSIWAFRQTHEAAYEVARATAYEGFRKDLLYRRWSSLHGGVYAPVTPQTPPNPYLSHLPERDIAGPSGKQLTLINPAYMTRQVYELAARDTGSQGHITSLKPIRPENAPDDWERHALQSFERGVKEATSIEPLGGEPYLRFMRPLIADPPCLGCHGRQGYKAGEIRGGISVSIPWAPFGDAARSQWLAQSAGYGAVWLLGLFGLLHGRHRIDEQLVRRHRAEQALRESEARYRTLTEWSPEAVAVHRAGRLLYVNPAALKLFGARSADEMVGRPIFDFIHPDYHRMVRERIRRSAEHQGAAPPAEEVFMKLDGTPVPVEVQGREIIYDGAPAAHAIIHDISGRKQAEEEIRRLAFYDPLSGLPNRQLLLDRLRHALASSARSGRQFALLFIDLDNFKTLNDNLGHGIGDLLLKHTAVRLTACVREVDTVARLGGDEFVVLLEDLSERSEEAAAQAEAVARKILERLAEPCRLDGHDHRATASIGITLCAESRETTEELLKRADMAMYQAKAAGHNTLRFFDPQMQAAVSKRAATESDLREALLRRQFELHYQAQVDADGRLTGVEALLRWRHPGRGMVAPLEFIPLAEETGLILPIGDWVLQAACAQLAGWAAQPGLAHLTIAVNVSARQIQQADFAERVMAALEQTGADPSRLELELTESLLVQNAEDAIAKMARLKARGVRFSLDDFGTGYSSLAYLKRLPLDQLKIDRGFVRDILTDPNDAAIARTVVVLAESLGLEVIAEGVETEEQRDFLARGGCRHYQGYLFARPLPPAEFEELARGKWRPATTAS